MRRRWREGGLRLLPFLSAGRVHRLLLLDMFASKATARTGQWSPRFCQHGQSRSSKWKIKNPNLQDLNLQSTWVGLEPLSAWIWVPAHWFPLASYITSLICLSDSWREGFPPTSCQVKGFFSDMRSTVNIPENTPCSGQSLRCQRDETKEANNALVLKELSPGVRLGDCAHS